MNPWEQLGIEPTTDKRAIKSAYAKKLKADNLQENPEAFQQLREALDEALARAETSNESFASEPFTSDPAPRHQTSAAESEEPQSTLSVKSADNEMVVANAANSPDADFNEEENSQQDANNQQDAKAQAGSREWQNFFDRLQYYVSHHGDDEGQWQVIFHDELLDDVGTRQALAPEVFQLMAEAHHQGIKVHPAIIQRLDAIFSWKNIELELSERFPPEYFDFLSSDSRNADTQKEPQQASGNTSMTIAAIIGFNLLVFLLCLQLVS